LIRNAEDIPYTSRHKNIEQNRKLETCACVSRFFSFFVCRVDAF